MQTLGFSLKEITRLAQLRTDKDHACESVREFLRTKLAEVAVKLQELQQVQVELKADLRKCNQALKHRHGKKACAWPVLEGTEASHLRLELKAQDWVTGSTSVGSGLRLPAATKRLSMRVFHIKDAESTIPIAAERKKFYLGLCFGSACTSASH
jgi:hypothetical protein